MLITKMFNMAWKKKSVWEKKEKTSLKSLHFFNKKGKVTKNFNN